MLWSGVRVSFVPRLVASPDEFSHTPLFGRPIGRQRVDDNVTGDDFILARLNVLEETFHSESEV